MTRAEREAFLADVHVGVISIEQPDGPPLAVPIWYDYAPEVGVRVITDRGSQKGRALEAAGRFTLVAQTEEPPAYRYVSVSGPIVEVVPADLETHRRPMALRYFGPGLGDLYAESAPGEDNLIFTMRPERWRTVDYGKILPGAGDVADAGNG
jgi:nitroimidazol reductase NimA-like FMN-containing flavoprotein (pyridoxamine 5'-phosphate oxidase superfamily)